ncbi:MULTISPECIES: Ig-like domain-containing protein [Clostridium]|uniref:Ig-like domain-containing protein n=1 Tax=Clostridium TaxID=1485 RepID=UPI000826F87F|nr:MULTISPECIES: Ig-like domain-containing protein [Clostridium]
MNTQLNQFNALLKRSGKSCILNNSTTKVSGIFKEIDDKAKEIDTKYFYTTMPLKQGDMISYNNITYIVITLNQSINNVYSIYVIRECPFYLNYWCGDTLKVTPIFVDTKVFDTASTTYMQLADGQVYITVQSNNYTNLINLNDRMIKFGYAWKVIAIDRTITGILKLNCKVDGFINGDDEKGEIPIHTVATHTYVVTVTPSSIPNLSVGSTQQLTASVTEDGTAINNATFTYTSSDTTIATISTSGLVTAVKAGSVTITVAYNNHTATVSITVISSTPTASYTLNGSTVLKVGNTGTWTVLNSDGTTPTESFNFTVSDTNKATKQGTTSNSVTLKGVTYGQIKLTATDSNGISCWKVISVQNGW